MRDFQAMPLLGLMFGGLYVAGGVLIVLSLTAFGMVYLAYPPGTEGHPPDLPVALVLCAPDGSDRRRILEFIGGQGTMNVPNWAPDGHAFAFVRYTP